VTVANPIGFDPTYNAATVGDYTLGAIYSSGPKDYIFVLNANGASDNAIADGDVCYWASATTYTVCNALNGTGSALAGNPFIGVGIGAIAKNQYGFLQFRGLHTNVKSTSSTAGVVQKVSATAATATDQTAATIDNIGTGLTATSGGRCTVAIRM
jgi:hypothetical protein